MARVTKDQIKQANAMLAAIPVDIAVPATLLAGWTIPWEGRCVDPTCRTLHHMCIGLTISDDHLTDNLPAGKITVIEDGALPNGEISARVPLTKNQIVELIADLQEMLGEMP